MPRIWVGIAFQRPGQDPGLLRTESLPDGIRYLERGRSGPAVRSELAAPDRQPADEQCRLTHTDGHPLACLAAVADAGVQLQVIADRLHMAERGRSVADQRRTLHRRADLAVRDAVGLGAGKDELLSLIHI